MASLGLWLTPHLLQTIKHNQQIQHNRTLSYGSSDYQNRMLTSSDFRKDWQRRVRTHFDQVHLPSQSAPTHLHPPYNHL